VALRLPKRDYQDIERIIELDFVRATEAAALNSLRWLGRGDKEAADAAACDAMRGMFDLMNICGEVVIGEGIKDEAPGIFKGEQLGTWVPGSPEFHIAIDPIDGTTNISKGAPNSISCIAAASPEKGVKVALRDVPSFYMSKLAFGPRVIDYMRKRGDSLHLEMPIAEILAIVAHAVDKRVQDVAVMMLDRPRHKEIVEQIRAAGASLRMIGDGDIAAAIAPSLPESDVDLYMGIGGSPEAVLAAAGIKCLGGDMQCKMWPRGRDTVYFRWERVQKSGHELVLDPPDESSIFPIGGYTIGYVRDLTHGNGLDIGLGTQLTFNDRPDRLDRYYGDDLGYAFQFFLRIRPSLHTHGGHEHAEHIPGMEK
jgi:fructose-1,6-bisphosphatase II